MRAVGIGLICGIVGFLVAWGGWHLYLDHQNFHLLQNFVVEQVKAANGEKK